MCTFIHALEVMLLWRDKIKTIKTLFKKTYFNKS